MTSIRYLPCNLSSQILLRLAIAVIELGVCPAIYSRKMKKSFWLVLAGGFFAEVFFMPLLGFRPKWAKFAPCPLLLLIGPQRVWLPYDRSEPRPGRAPSYSR